MCLTAAEDSPGTELAPLTTLTPAARRLGVEHADAGDEGARIGEVDVVAARRDAGARQPIVLLLERAGGVDQNVRPPSARSVLGRDARGIERGVGRRGPRAAARQRRRHARVPCRRASGDDDVEVRARAPGVRRPVRRRRHSRRR